MTSRFDWRTLVVVVVVAVGVVVGMVLYSDSQTPTNPPKDGPTSQSASMSRLVFAVWGSEAEVAAYQRIVDSYNAESAVVNVEIEAWPGPDAMLEDIRHGKVTPDLYLLPRDGLASTMEAGLNRPLIDLLDARGVQFGDDFSRDSVAAFSANDNLQCMPYTTSPMVMYYNAELIDFEAMEQRELPVPSEERDRWSLEQFRAAAEFASRPRTGAKGVHIDPTLEGLAPFVLSGGGQLFDDAVDPGSLALSDDGSADAMRETLEVLRDPRITLSNAQLERRSALEWFQAGRLGMIAGFRELTPVLRDTPGLRFDVMPMPVLDSVATVGRITGVCVAEGEQPRVEQAADFLVYLVSDQAVSEVTDTGYLMPTNLEVAFSTSFLQPGREPENAAVFNAAVQSIALWPLLENWRDLELVVHHDLSELLTEPVLPDLDAMLAEIDERSQMVLGPQEDEEDEEDEEESDPTDSPSSPSDPATP